MEKRELERLFESIVKDDLKSFSSVMLSKSDLNISFGRFPILSLLYLYGSYKILEKYERFLLPIHNFNVVEENYDAYLKFKKHAKKSLKIFVFGEKIIYPIEMLAVLDERYLLNKYYKKLFKNEEIVKNIRKIYILNQKTEIEISHEDIVISKSKLKFIQKIAMISVLCVMSFVIAFSAVSIALIKNRSGIGTASAPIKISTEQEFQTAIKKGNKHYSLQNNITLTQNFEAFDFSGSFDGNGYEVVGGTYLSDGLVENLTGTIEDLKVSAEIKTKNISQNYSIIAKKSSGNVQNVKLFAEINWQAHNDTDIYLAGLVAHNTGLVENSSIEISGKINNNRSSNVFFAAAVGLNDGMVKNCATETARIEADTVDLGGLVAVNNNLVENSENKLTLVQTSAKEWHPNTAGVCITNYGKVVGCKNTAEVFAESTVSEDKQDSDYAVIVGGIVCDNYGEVCESTNSGKIVAKGNVSLCYVGGIAARNILNDKKAVIEKCKATNVENSIFAYSKTNLICVGGIAGHNSSKIINSGFVGKLDAKTDVDVSKVSSAHVAYVGGVVGYNSANEYCLVKSCYADVTEFVGAGEISVGDRHLYGYVIGYLGATKYIPENLVIAWGLLNVEDNHYVVHSSNCGIAYGSEVTITPFPVYNSETKRYEYQIIASNTINVTDSTIFAPHDSLDSFLNGEGFVDD